MAIYQSVVTQATRAEGGRETAEPVACVYNDMKGAVRGGLRRNQPGKVEVVIDKNDLSVSSRVLPKAPVTSVLATDEPGRGTVILCSPRHRDLIVSLGIPENAYQCPLPRGSRVN